MSARESGSVRSSTSAQMVIEHLTRARLHRKLRNLLRRRSIFQGVGMMHRGAQSTHGSFVVKLISSR
jgi:hypothetical protein